MDAGMGKSQRLRAFPNPCLHGGPKVLFRGDRKWMIRLAGNSGFRVVSRVYLLERAGFARRQLSLDGILTETQFAFQTPEKRNAPITPNVL